MAHQRIWINCGGGYVPGLNGAVVGIRDGYDGLLFPDRYPEGHVVTLDARAHDKALMLQDTLNPDVREG